MPSQTVVFRPLILNGFRLQISPYFKVVTRLPHNRIFRKRHIVHYQQYDALALSQKNTQRQLVTTLKYGEICSRKPFKIRGLKTTVWDGIEQEV